MNILLAVLLVLVVFIGVVTYEVMRIVRKVNVAIALGKETTPFTRTEGEEGKRILVIGDSYAYGTGAGDPNLSLAGRLAADMPGHTLVNAAENAMPLARLIEKFDEIEGSHSLTLIQTGGVDMASFTSLPKIRGLIKTAIQKAKQKTHGQVVFVSLSNPADLPGYRFPLTSIFSWRSKLVSDLSDEVCREEGVMHVVWWEPRGTAPFRKDPARFSARDTLHPSGEGYAYLYEKIRRTLSDL